MQPTEKMKAAERTVQYRYREERRDLRRTGNHEQVSCIAKLDRLILTAVALVITELCKIPGYRAVRTKRVWGQLYREVTRIYGTSSIHQVIVESSPNVGWVPKHRITIIPRDASGLLFDDLRFILELIPRFKIVLMEIALDFPISSLIDPWFVRRYALFGTTWLRVGQNELHARYGRAKSSKTVRVYVKFEASIFRIELQLQARFLRQHKINHASDFAKLAKILPIHHVYFAALYSAKLQKQLLRSVPSRTRRNEILKAVAARKTSLWATLRYLRRDAKLTNVRRLLTPLVSINNMVTDALVAWAGQWSSRAKLNPGTEERQISRHGENE